MNIQEMLNQIVDELKASDSFLHLLGSTLVLFIAILIVRSLLRRYIRNSIQSADLRRRWLIQLRNALVLVLLFGLVMIWGNELRTFALSLVAIAVALVIATKELIICISGSLIKSGARSFNLGDRIQVKDFRGDVIDQNLLTTTLLEVGPGKTINQRSGRMVVVPNSIFVSEPVVNESYSRNFVLHAFTVPFKREENWKLAQQALLSAAQKQCEDYLPLVRKHFDKLSYRTGLESPSVEPRVSIQVPVAGEIHLVVRVPTHEDQRNIIEQAILNDTFSNNIF
ncbi:mechanosensitive ion channel domain-containing protein [Idiomarina tyrosinivorans]|nr:mechanosensitive ion channel domain-containing protein [Idiomarina tyrosinivorans]